jgi:hypothetical protein
MSGNLLLKDMATGEQQEYNFEIIDNILKG